jgi:hypothetical protein
MPQAWKNLFAVIQDGNDHYHNQPILRSDVNKIVDQLKKCPPRKREDTYRHSFVERAGRQEPTTNPPIAPREQFPAPRMPHELDDGMYRRPKDGKIFKVYHTVHGANVQVAKELIVVDAGLKTDDGSWYRQPTVKFDYRGRKPLYTLTPAMRLSIEEARDFGACYGTCCICGRTLTNELSIHLGIGPICGRREFGGDFEFMVNDARGYIDGEVESVTWEDKIADLDAQIKELEEGEGDK